MHSLGINREGELRDNQLSEVHLEKWPLIRSACVIHSGPAYFAHALTTLHKIEQHFTAETRTCLLSYNNETDCHEAVCQCIEEQGVLYSCSVIFQSADKIMR